jgi:hypothetical protein
MTQIGRSTDLPRASFKPSSQPDSCLSHLGPSWLLGVWVESTKNKQNAEDAAASKRCRHEGAQYRGESPKHAHGCGVSHAALAESPGSLVDAYLQPTLLHPLHLGLLDTPSSLSVSSTTNKMVKLDAEEQLKRD